MTSMNNYWIQERKYKGPAPHMGEIWLAQGLPFDDGIHSKDRPVLVDSRHDDVLICYKCTSKHSESRKRYEIKDLDSAGLKVISYLDYTPVLIPRKKLVYLLGVLSNEDKAAFGRLGQAKP